MAARRPGSLAPVHRIEGAPGPGRYMQIAFYVYAEMAARGPRKPAPVHRIGGAPGPGRYTQRPRPPLSIYGWICVHMCA